MKKLTLILLIITNILFAQDSKLIKEIVISGAKKETNKIEISQTIDIISKKELKFNSASNTGDALQNTGVITVQQSQNGGGSPMMRGFEANRIGIVVDGVRMNTAIFRGGHLQNAMRVDNGQLERIELFYGAGSTLYGSDALGGVLNFMTTRPVLKTDKNSNVINGWDLLNNLNSAFIRYNSANNEKTGGFTINIADKKWASLTSFTYSDFGNVMMGDSRDPQFKNWGKRYFIAERVNNVDVMTTNENPNEQVNSGYKQYNILQKILIQPNEKLNHLINFQYSNSSDVNRYDRLTEKVNNAKDADPISNKFSTAEWYYGPEARLMAAYTINKKFNETLYDNIKFTAAYQNYKESRNTRNFGNNNFRSQRENVDVFSLNFDAYKTTKKHQFTYGIEYVGNWVASSVKRFNIMTGSESYASTRYPDGGSQTGSTAFYLQDIFRISKDRLYLNLGGRISQNTITGIVTDTNRKYGSFDISNLGYSFNAGVCYIPTKFNKICFNFSTGYRTPNLDDVTKVFDNTSWIQVNDPNVKPELAMNFEINSWNKLSESSLIEFGGYYTAVSDFIMNQVTTLNGQSLEIINGKSYTYQRLGNSATAMILGTYASYKFNIDEHWEFNGNLNYTFGRVRMAEGQDQKPLDHIPPLSGRMALKFKQNKFQSELSMMLNGTKKTEEYSTSGEDNIDKSADPVNGYTPAWEVFNFRTSYNFNENYTAQIAVENIFDIHYRVFASGISSPGRSLRMTLRASF